MDTTVINLALSFNGWIYGGYVRDILICKGSHYHDIDIAIAEYNDYETLIKSIKSLSPDVHVYEDMLSGYIHSSILRVFKIRIGEDLLIDLVVVKSFSEWQDDHSCDMTCNLFYKSKMQCGIRYVPDDYEFSPDPMNELMVLTKQKRFRVLQRISDRRLDFRIKTREELGWVEDI